MCISACLETDQDQIKDSDFPEDSSIHVANRCNHINRLKKWSKLKIKTFRERSVFLWFANDIHGFHDWFNLKQTKKKNKNRMKNGDGEIIDLKRMKEKRITDWRLEWREDDGRKTWLIDVWIYEECVLRRQDRSSFWSHAIRATHTTKTRLPLTLSHAHHARDSWFGVHRMSDS